MKIDEKEGKKHTSLWPIVALLVIVAVIVLVSWLTGNCCSR